jgi:hypothetical protein
MCHLKTNPSHQGIILLALLKLFNQSLASVVHKRCINAKKGRFSHKHSCMALALLSCLCSRGFSRQRLMYFIISFLLFEKNETNYMVYTDKQSNNVWGSWHQELVQSKRKKPITDR